MEAYVVLAFLVILAIVGGVKLNRIEQKLERLERVGVLMTSDREAGRVAKPMSPRERIRWIERRWNGFQRQTP